MPPVRRVDGLLEAAAEQHTVMHRVGATATALPSSVRRRVQIMSQMRRMQRCAGRERSDSINDFVMDFVFLYFCAFQGAVLSTKLGPCEAFSMKSIVATEVIYTLALYRLKYAPLY